jgi:hypothetical protein
MRSWHGPVPNPVYDSFLCVRLHVFALLCLALLCIALLSIALLRFALLGFALHCCALLCFALLCIALHCFALLCFACLCIALHCFALLCFALLCSAFLGVTSNVPHAWQSTIFAMHGSTSLTQAHVQHAHHVQNALTPLRRGRFSNTTLGSVYCKTAGFVTQF